MNDPHDYRVELAPEDGRLLGLLVDAGFDAERLEPLADDERIRVRALLSLFGLLGDYPVDDPDRALVDATLLRVDTAEAERSGRMRLDAASQRRRGLPFRMPDLISVAAIILIGVSILWPVMDAVRKRSIDVACSNNMRAMNEAFSLYARDYDDAVPTALAAFPLGSWDRVRNVVNLKPLVEGGYCTHGHLNCPGNHADFAPGYSYQLPMPGETIRWGRGGAQAILGDRNPLIDAFTASRVLPSLSVSANHGGRGQNVLQTDGAITWLELPEIGSDNIWLPAGADALESGMQTSDPRDVFLAH